MAGLGLCTSSQALISDQEMVVNIEEVHAKLFENPEKLNRNVETILISSEG